MTEMHDDYQSKNISASVELSPMLVDVIRPLENAWDIRSSLVVFRIVAGRVAHGRVRCVTSLGLYGCCSNIQPLDGSTDQKMKAHQRLLWNEYARAEVASDGRQKSDRCKIAFLFRTVGVMLRCWEKAKSHRLETAELSFAIRSLLGRVCQSKIEGWTPISPSVGGFSW